MYKAIRDLKERDERGFTLIELLIVIAIIAILAVIAIPQFAGYRQRAVRSSMQADARNIATLLEANFADNQTYPSPSATAGGSVTIGSQTGRMSPGNSLAVTGGADSYTVVVTNTQGGTGSDDYSLTSAGVSGFY